MAGGSPRSMTRAEIDALLREATIAHLAMVDGVWPYVVPINFGYDRDCLYFKALRIGRKVAVLRANPRVSFVVGEGLASFVEARTEKARALDSLLGKFCKGPFKYSPKLLDDALIVRVRIESLSGRRVGK